MPCIKTTDGVENTVWTGATISESCTRSQDNVYTDHALGLVAATSLVIVSDWRNSRNNISNKAASLSIGFTELNPATNFSRAAELAMWVDLGVSYHTQVVDLDSRPVWGAYLIIRFTCSTSDCEQTTISYVGTSIWKITPFGDF